jgi:mRNA interferase RelE/StbE
MYELKFDKGAIDFINSLERGDKERIWNKLQQCKLNPFHFLEHLEEIKGFKLRVGDFRLIIDVDRTNQLLHILKAGHRKNVYEN